MLDDSANAYGLSMGITPVSELVEAAKAQITNLSVEEAKAAVADGALIVDIRDVRELERDGTIPDSLHAPRGMVEFWVDPASPYHREVFAEDRTYIFSCASGWRSALTAKTLQDMGMTNVAHLDVGFTGWRDAGEPVAERKPRT